MFLNIRRLTMDFLKIIEVNKVPMKPQNAPCVFFDQNVMDKMSKQTYTSFQKNVEKILLENGKNFQQRFTPFGLLEFAGLNKKELFDIEHKGYKLSEYPFRSYQEAEDFIPCLQEKIQNKIPKEFLKEKLESKRQKDFFYFNQHGLKIINKYIDIIDSIYDWLVNSFFLDRCSQIKTSAFSFKEKQKFILLLTRDVMEMICQGQFIGSFRLICKLMGEHRSTPTKEGMFNRGSPHFDTMQRITKICEKLKSSGDLVDCELVHLAFFGANNCCCHCYTTDSKEDINDRLELYCMTVHFFIWLFFDSPNQNYREYFLEKKYKRPEWRYGEVFILNKETGEEIHKISVQEIYENISKKSSL